MNESEWKSFLVDYSREILADEKSRQHLPAEVVESGWLGHPPASEDDLKNLETKLGVNLPPSYRSFLRVSNGWRRPNAFIQDLWSCSGIAWFSDRNQEWIDAYAEPASDLPPLSDAEYLIYGDAQDTCKFRSEYLQTALEISDTGDAAIMLLNPKTVTAEGEWEAWFFANWYPGAHRYRSFEEMMVHERQSFLHLCQNRAISAAATPVRKKARKPWWKFW